MNFIRSIFQRSKVVAGISEPTKMVLIVRSDLNMLKGKTGAQCAHAAIMCYEKAAKQQPDLLSAWLNTGQPKIVLRAESLKEIEKIANEANEKNIIHGMIHDAGRTQVAAGTITVLGVGPDTISRIDSVARHLRLL